MTALIITLIVLGGAVLVWRWARRKAKPPQPPQVQSPRVSTVQVRPTPPAQAPVPPFQEAAPPVTRAVPAVAVPPAVVQPIPSSRTAEWDDVDAERPDTDQQALAATRANVTASVPDAVLADALLDATPEQLRQVFASVPTDVLQAAVGQAAPPQATPAPQEADLAQLKGLGQAVEDLDFWDFDKKN